MQCGSCPRGIGPAEQTWAGKDRSVFPRDWSAWCGSRCRPGPGPHATPPPGSSQRAGFTRPPPAAAVTPGSGVALSQGHQAARVSSGVLRPHPCPCPLAHKEAGGLGQHWVRRAAVQVLTLRQGLCLQGLARTRALTVLPALHLRPHRGRASPLPGTPRAPGAAPSTGAGPRGGEAWAPPVRLGGPRAPTPPRPCWNWPGQKSLQVEGEVAAPGA